MRAILRTAIGCLGLVALASFPTGATQDGEGAAVEAWLARLAAAEARGAEEGERAVRAGLELGPAAAAGAMLGGGERFAALTLDARRARVWLLGAVGDERAIEPAVGLLADGDAGVRSAAVDFLSRPDLGLADVERRAAALARLAETTRDRETAVEAVAALARIDHALTTAALARLARALPAPERRLAARGLAAEPRAREEVVRTVQDAFSGAAELPSDVLAELLAVYGQRLAELPQGGRARADRAPFVLGTRHPDPDVQRLSALALDGFVARVRGLGDAQRAVDVLAALLGAGLGDAELHRRRALLILAEGADPEPALAAARALRAATDLASGDLEGRFDHATGALLEGAALLALGRGAEARAHFEAAEHALAGLVAERLELAGSERLALLAANACEALGVIDTYRALELLAAGAAVGDAPVLAHARAAHEHGLEAHLAMLTGDFLPQGEDCVASILEHACGPLALVLSNPRSQAFPRRRALDLARSLCEALASAAPTELPGFARVESLEPRLTNPLEDPVRGALLGSIQGEFYRLWEREIEREIERLTSDPRRNSVGRQLRQSLEARRRRDEEEGPLARLRLRAPGSLALRVAGDLREDGRFGEARGLAERLEVDLRASEGVRSIGPFAENVSRDLLAAQARLLVGDSWMDEDQPARAEEICLAALEQFELLEKVMHEQGRPAEAAQARILQADALVSLAVNANVKQGDPEQALAYFERAYALRRDDFTQVLLACYRARAGHALEAREALRETPVIPGNYYNLACTFALLGDAETALDFLRRDLDEKRPAPGALARQQAWAKDDPDLASLRGDPRFEALVRRADDERSD